MPELASYLVTNLGTPQNGAAAIDGRISQANGRLKASKSRCSIERRGGTLWLRGTLPPKPGAVQSEPYRQKLALGVKATVAGLQHAEKQARRLSLSLDDGSFQWSDWLEADTNLGTVGYWVERLEANYWQRRAKSLKALETWQSNYARVFVKLPSDQQLTEQVLRDAIDATAPDSQPRRRTVQALAKLAKLAGLEVNLSELTGNYSARSVNPRSLPTDATIAAVRDGIVNPGWRWVLGMIACYGLRLHEVFHTDLTDFPLLRITEDTKTGARFVYPLYPEWAIAWELGDRVLPALRVLGTAGNTKLGAKVSGFFNEKGLPFRPYDLRHCYARRCFEFDLGVDLGAQLMGHSPEVHKQTYRAWIDEATYRKVFDRLVYRSDAPKAP
ncbi:MAG: site-specific integrase [Lyngbya sp. HA4199-MV5]|jgi:integrase|nr:site-specific integrase [Lyngbya sp. HA4199-MV5]